MKVMNHTEEQQTENKTSLSNGAKRNRIFIYIAIAGVIAAVITAAFTGYYLHQERAEEKKQEELLKAEKAKRQKEKKAKTTETAETEVRACPQPGRGTGSTTECDRTVGQECRDGRFCSRL